MAQAGPDAAEKSQKETTPAEEAKSVSSVLNAVQIALDSYDDIFSDFDFSAYPSRLLSDDFLKELRKHYSETKKGEFMVNFTLPRTRRDPKTETIIRRRLKEHFKNRLAKTEDKVRESKNKGIVRVSAAVLLSLVIFLVPEFESLPVISLLPALFWYLAWSGFELFLDAPSRLSRKIGFCRRFMQAKYNFQDEEGLVESITVGSSYR